MAQQHPDTLNLAACPTRSASLLLGAYSSCRVASEGENKRVTLVQQTHQPNDTGAKGSWPSPGMGKCALNCGRKGKMELLGSEWVVWCEERSSKGENISPLLGINIEKQKDISEEPSWPKPP